MGWIGKTLPARLPPLRVATKELNSFAVKDHPGEQWVCLRSRAGDGGGVKVEATMFDAAAEPFPEDAPLFRRVESLKHGRHLYLSLIIEVTWGLGRPRAQLHLLRLARRCRRPPRARPQGWQWDYCSRQFNFKFCVS
ncbi:hypothetical protein PVAP13_6NG190600 [Panicum virgatum]|uniref:Uncharacterized protein n=1 Tax=Panicum virgatum TaxID=38727 RepID=A0A8T0QZ16_PANVG|nr:hypothetical protein PVAP13_6NG190600 [Panicum virgatum]